MADGPDAVPPVTTKAHSSYRHEAFLYRGAQEFLDGVLPFVQDGVDRGQPVMVALVPERLEPLIAPAQLLYELPLSDAHAETLLRLARLDKIEFGKPPSGAVQIVLDEAVLALPLAGIIDIDAEQKRLKREIDKIGSEIRQLDAKLGNEKFVSRAPEHVVEEQRERKTEAESVAAKLEQALKRLEAAL